MYFRSEKAELGSFTNAGSASGKSDNETIGESDLEEIYKSWNKYRIGDKLDR